MNGTEVIIRYSAVGLVSKACVCGRIVTVASNCVRCRFSCAEFQHSSHSGCEMSLRLRFGFLVSLSLLTANASVAGSVVQYRPRS